MSSRPRTDIVFSVLVQGTLAAPVGMTPAAVGAPPDATGRTSNTVTETVTGSPLCP
jgi:hypothetical protein